MWFEKIIAFNIEDGLLDYAYVDDFGNVVDVPFFKNRPVHLYTITNSEGVVLEEEET